MKKVGVLLALLILLSVPAAAWNRTLAVSARDASGQPMQGAHVQITYQKDSNSSLDGSIAGRTEKDGTFIAALSNSVNASLENRKITVRLWTYYWEGQEKSVLAGEPGSGAAAFQVPYTLEKIYVSVSGQDGKPSAGASVGIYGTDLQAATGSDGLAVLEVPQGLPFSGFARLGAQSAQFTSEQISISDGKKTARVVFGAQQPAGRATGQIVFRATVLGAEGRPLAGQEITVEAGGQNSSVSTSADGSFSFGMQQAGSLKVYTLYHEYAYEFAYQVSADRNETIALAPQLRIDSFAAEKDAAGCYNVAARVSDPRSALPIQVVIVRYAGNSSYSYQPALDESGRFAARVCANESGHVTARASNKYETVESQPLQISGTAAPPQGAPVLPPTSPPPAQQAPPGGVQGSGLREVPVALFIAIVAVGAVAAAAFFFARKQASTLLRFINEYLRTVYKILAGRRLRGPPPIIPPEQV